MKKHVYFFLCCLFFTNEIYSQTSLNLITVIEFSYDASGNRVQRKKVSMVGSRKNIIDNIPDSLISIYPNPANTFVNIELKGYNGDIPTNLTLIDFNGKVFFDQRIMGTFYNLDLRDFASGIYILTLRRQEYSQNWKIIKAY